MQELVRFYAYYRIKVTCFTPFAPRPTNFFGFSFATVLSRRNGYRVNIVTNIINNYHSSLTESGIWVSNPISYTHLRFSASIISR